MDTITGDGGGESAKIYVAFVVTGHVRDRVVVVKVNSDDGFIDRNAFDNLIEAHSCTRWASMGEAVLKVIEIGRLQVQNGRVFS
jgi:hypothetical protein